MAEERIRVLVSKNPCEKCEIKPCTRKCMFATLFEKAPGITRTEAIEKMAKGMYLLTNPEDTKYADFYNCYYFELAEAALNALLGE